MKYLELGHIDLHIARVEDSEINKISLDTAGFLEIPEMRAYIKSLANILNKEEIINHTLYHITLTKDNTDIFKFILNEEQLQALHHTLGKHFIYLLPLLLILFRNHYLPLNDY